AKKAAAKKVAKKAPAKKAAAKKVAKKAGTKKVAKKAPAKKAEAKKVTKKVESKKVTKKAEPKKAAPKKVTKKAEPKKAEVVQEVAEPVQTQIEEVIEEKKPKAKAKKSKSQKVNEKFFKEEFAEEVLSLSDDYSIGDVLGSIQTLDFFVSKVDECLEKGCDNPATTLGYCRLHYIKNWNDIKRKQVILKEGKLQLFIEELVSKYPLKYIESIISDLADEKTFFGVLRELDIISEAEDIYDENIEEDGDDDQDIAYETKTTSKAAAFSGDDE
ncbi:MAG: hypothetical protein ACPGJV_08825, partial [Bacteriovoracaceae bacterium]